ncbi:hypothetical protein JOF29_000370 [Kribbella aluminosa]|uniref:Uncharacterized protein n=1 Tax=Kribbella aluminosa TaxID=416017 RepID=A0ABS4UCC2_9ACTN|nr:hypothetical protein [Kribbella aluminosa]MBP2349287.1 hypothetical protein [Kribbella aluminosa]
MRYQQYGDRALSDRPARMRSDEHRTAGKPIGDRATDQHEAQHRDHPRGQHDAELRRIAGRVEDRERERYRRHRTAQQ